jgi:regulator of sigma E protease
MDHFLTEVGLYAQVVFGVGFIIFWHELGHFLAARFCKVRVETFSLGFGPKIFGWTSGTTTYQIAAVPLGGYVKMAGEESVGEGRTPAPDELPAKSVGQRFLIYSGGVIMNVLFGLIVFPFVFAAGVPFAEPLIGVSDQGSPAWHAGLKPGTRVISVNGNDVYAFMHIPTEVALGSPEETELVIVEPGSTEKRSVRLTPVRNEAMGAFSIGVRPAADPNGTILVNKDSPAGKAGLQDGDRVLAFVGAPAGLTLEKQVDCVSQLGQPVTARFSRDGREFEATITPEPSAEHEVRMLGVGPIYNRVTDLRNTPLAKATGLRKDDRILSVNGVPTTRPYDFVRALQAKAGAPSLRVKRDGSTLELAGPDLDLARSAELAEEIAIGFDSDETRVVVTPDSAAYLAGLRDGDRLTSVGGKEVHKFSDIQDVTKSSKEGAVLAITVERQDSGDGVSTSTFDVTPKAYRPPNYGFGIKDAQYVYKAASPFEAMKVGVHASWKFIEESYVTLKRIALGHVSGSNIGGIITIGVVSHSWAADGFAKLLFFLCMLSMNLAFLNVLPIPVLDGGHLLFLLVEKIKGSPVSERVLGYSQIVGVVLIGFLMLMVTFNDVMRWFVR